MWAKIYGKQFTIFVNDTLEKTYVACGFQRLEKPESISTPSNGKPQF